MKIQNMIKKITIAILSAAMMLAPIVNIKAASTDVVDTSKTGSITIHKYDMTAAKQAGVNTSQFTPTGKQDAAAEAALEKYAIKGVEFSYLRVGDVEQQSENGKIQMIYELPTTIQQILGLTFSDSKGDATKVKFVVKNKTDNYYLVARADRAGVYQVTGKSAKEADATQFSPSSDGKLVINGIEGDEYGFTETHSDAGYSLLKKEVIVKVKETKADITPTEANITGIQSKSDADSTANDGVPNGSVLKNDVTVQTTAASATVDETKATMTKHDDSGNAYINMQITNQKQFMLPMTGGAGNYLLIIAGVVVAGCGILILNKNRGRSQR